MSFFFFMIYYSNNMFLLSKYFLKFSLGCAGPCNITIIYIPMYINEKYIMDRHFLFRCRIPLNRSSKCFEIWVSTNLIWLCQFRFRSIITPRNFNSFTLFSIVLLKFEFGNLRRIWFQSVCLWKKIYLACINWQFIRETPISNFC